MLLENVVLEQMNDKYLDMQNRISKVIQLQNVKKISYREAYKSQELDIILQTLQLYLWVMFSIQIFRFIHSVLCLFDNAILNTSLNYM